MTFPDSPSKPTRRPPPHRTPPLQPEVRQILDAWRKPLANITWEDVQQWRAQALARGLTPATVNRRLAMLRSVLPPTALPRLFPTRNQGTRQR